ncbi:MAG: hypothetical protein GX906_02120 [Clostridiales bacterium]|jgi:hypothetical protein|nr:hypothetical protein [Clostridiales bacterium]
MPTHPTVTKRIEILLEFEKYQRIMDTVLKENISTNETFKKLFNGYYGIRRDSNWQTKYYQYFQKHKRNLTISFDEIIDYIYNNLLTSKGGKMPVEPSFSSKMLATINPNMPIYDKKVRTNMKLKELKGTPAEKLKQAKETYMEICNRYNSYLPTPECSAAISIFNTYFPNYMRVSTVKKVDWFLFALTRTELISMKIFNALL